MNSKVSKLLSTAVATIVFAGVYYLTLPALNVHSIGCWVFVLAYLTTLAGIFWAIDNIESNDSVSSKVMVIVAAIIFAAFLFAGIGSGAAFNASVYSNLVTVPEGVSFTEALPELETSELIVADKATCQQVGKRQMGTLTELVSQYNVSDTYTQQVNTEGKNVRISPLEHAGFFKWVNSKGEIPGYIEVDTNTMSARYVQKEITASPSGYFGDDLTRILRGRYLCEIFAPQVAWSFEVDPEGNPYWIVPCYDYTSVFGGKKVNRVIMVDAATRESSIVPIEKVPEWVDHVLPGDVIVEHLNYALSLKGGWLNSIVGQKGVTVTTDGYGYINIGDQVYLYTGVTSVVSDESNIGFILVNTRTEEISYVECPSAEEYSAMDSAKGSVQEKGYEASFPILMNIKGNPAYFLTLKDEAGLIKAYSIVNAQDYTKVTVADTLEKAWSDFTGASMTTSAEEIPTDAVETTVVVDEISSAVVDGNTIYYIFSRGKIFTASIKISNELPFVKIGDEIPCKVSDTKIIEMTSTGLVNETTSVETETTPIETETTLE